MKKLGFNAKVYELIMRCLTSVSYSILYNGFPSGRFTPSRGFRQGDPITIFVPNMCGRILFTVERCRE